jgi:hypothetical protein
MSSCQDELFKRDEPPDYEVKCVYCDLTAMRSTMRGVRYNKYSCRDIEACKGRLVPKMVAEAGPGAKFGAVVMTDSRSDYDLVKPKIKIDISDPETKKIWDAAVAAKEEVDSWPEWKKGHLVPEERESDFKVDRCDACGAGNMQEMSGCKRLCRKCGYMRTCNDTV